MATTGKGAGWKPGHSGNPKGRPPGFTETTRMRAALAEHLPRVLETLAEKAKEGDLAAIRILLDRVLPPLRPVDVSSEVPLPADAGLAQRAETVAHALAAGTLPLNQGAAILGGLATVARLKEIEELEQRISVLEKGHEGRT